MANNTARLGDLATYINGYAFKPADWGDTGLPIIRIQDLTGNSYQLNRYDGEYPERIEVNDGDVLISWSASLGVYVWHRGKALLNQHIFKVVFDKLPVNKDYFVFAVEHKLAEMESKTHGATMKHIVKKDFDGTTIPYPPIEKQAEIADHLRHITSLIDRQTEQLLLLDQLVKSRFIELFGEPQRNPHGYKQTKLSDIATYYNGLTYKPENVAAEGTIVLRSSNIQNSQLDFADTVRVDCAIKGRLMVQENDILMCSRNGSAKLVRKVALIKNIQEPMSFGAFMMIIRSRYFGYLMTYFQMDAFRQQIKAGATTTINQITGRMLDDVTIPLPTMALVDRFTAFVEQTDKSKYYKSIQILKLITEAIAKEVSHDRIR